MRRWSFVCGHPFLPSHGDPFAAGLGGTEQAILHLTAALAARGHQVHLTGAATTQASLPGIVWHPPGPPPMADITVAINDARLLPGVAGTGAGLAIVWFHNEVGLAREVRKRRLPALWRHRPAAVFIGTEQASTASRLLGLRARAVIPYGLPPRVVAAEPGGGPCAAPPEPQAIFTSQAYRGLREIIAMWRSRISPVVPAARLTAYIGANDVSTFEALAAGDASIRICPRIGNDRMLDVLRGARLLLAPGHISETFCLAAAEAIGMGVPVATLGIGSLKERVADGVTGLLCRDWASLADAARRILTDDALWHRLHAGGLATRAGQSWDRAATLWEGFAHEQIGR